MSSTPSLLTLPNECLIFVIDFLDTPQDLCSLSRCNKLLASLSADARQHARAVFSETPDWARRNHRKPSILAQAVLENDVALVHKLLARGGLDISAHHVYRFDRTPSDSALAAAVRRGDAEMFRFLGGQQPAALERFLAGDKHGYTGLNHAVRCGHMHMVKLLLRLGSPLNVPPHRESVAPLISAVEAGNVAMVKELLRRGAHVGSGYCGRTPLHYLGIKNANEIARILVAAGANVNARISSGRTPLHLACAVIHRPDRTESVSALIENGADMEVQDYTSTTPLALALEKGNFNIVRHLVENGATMAHPAWSSILSYAVAVCRGPGTDKMVQYFIDKGVPVPQEDSPRGYGGEIREFPQNFHYRRITGKSPLAYAAEDDNVQLVRLLLANGHPINHTDTLGRTPLHYAYGDCVQILLEHGASPDRRDYECAWSPFQYAIWHLDIEKARTLFNWNPSLHAADITISLRPELWIMEPSNTENKITEMIRFLLDHGADSSSTLPEDESGETVLHRMVYQGHRNIVRVLLERGANLEATNCFGQTPIFRACSGNKEMVGILIAAGANLGVRDISGATPMHIAAIEGRRPIMEELIKAGRARDLLVKDCMGRTPEMVYARPTISHLDARKPAALDRMLHGLGLKDANNNTVVPNGLLPTVPEVMAMDIDSPPSPVKKRKRTEMPPSTRVLRRKSEA